MNTSGIAAISGITCAATLKTVKINGSSVGLQANQFSGCSALQTVTIGPINVTTRVYSLENIVSGCSSLKNVSLTFGANSMPQYDIDLQRIGEFGNLVHDRRIPYIAE